MSIISCGIMTSYENECIYALFIEDPSGSYSEEE